MCAQCANQFPEELMREIQKALQSKCLLSGPSKPKSQLEKLTDCFIGWRVWNTRDGKLYSLTRSFVAWPFRRRMEVDDPNWHEDAHPNGIHAFLLRKQATGECLYGQVLGTVNLWGRVHRYSEGFRAEFAYPIKLYIHKKFDEFKIMELEENYAVPVEFAEDLPSEQPQQNPLQPSLSASQAQAWLQASQQTQLLQNLHGARQGLGIGSGLGRGFFSGLSGHK